MKKTGKTKVWILILLAFVQLGNSILFAQGKTYYVDSRGGNDSNNGTSATTAWKTLAKVSNKKYFPSDQVLLKRNETFSGSLVMKGSGKEGLPIKISSYGSGKKPVIDADSFNYGIKIINEQYWEINGIETKGGIYAGIFIGASKDSVTLNHFRITNCCVQGVGNGRPTDWNSSTLTGGIVVANGILKSNKVPLILANTVFNDVIIDGCTARYIQQWTCMSISSGHHVNVKGNANYIRNSTTEYSVADGIRMNGVQNSFIESCTMYKNGAWPNPASNWGGLGAWFFDADNCTIQFCEASYIDNPQTDGGAFDIDYWQTNSTVQYCYGHDCHSYGVSVFGADPARPTVNSTIRYNIFSNNGRDTGFTNEGDFFLLTWDGGLLDGVKIYNNTSYWNPVLDGPAVSAGADFTGKNPNLFVNNIIYSDSSSLVYKSNGSLTCDYNLYWSATGKPNWQLKRNKYYSLTDWQNATGDDKHSLYQDPLLVNPHYHAQQHPEVSFALQPGSPAIDAGTDIGNMGNRDYKGNKISVSGRYDIGALEAQSTLRSASTSTSGTPDKTFADSHNTFITSPNPVQDVLHLTYSGAISNHVWIRLFDVNGKKLWATELTPQQPNAAQNKEVLFKNYPHGTYTITSDDEDGHTFSKQIIK